jgi:hypothetical protein
MKKLTKDQINERDTHSKAIFDAHSELEDVITQFNKDLAAGKDAVEEATSTYNEALDNARTFCAEIVSVMEEYEGLRSDKWQESDAASVFQEWKSEWENVDLEDFEPDLPMDLEVPDNPQENLDVLPEEVSS